MIPVLLTQKIISLFVMMFLGAMAVKTKLLKSEDSKLFSKLAVYVIMPCMVISAFQIEYSDAVRDGLILAFVGAAVMSLMHIVVAEIWHKLRPLDEIEKMSLIYTNNGNLIIPLITYVMGGEWVIYSSAYISVQMFLIWSHGVMVLTGEKRINLKKIFGNVNMIAIMIGIVLLVLQVQFPAPLQDAIDSVGGMVGPICMIITGMVIAGMDLKKVISKPRIWVISLGRLVVIPVIGVLILKYSGLAGLTPNGSNILLITLLATAAPAATTITQLAQLFDKDVEYAGAINVLSTLLCIATMPLMVLLYQM